MLKKLLPDYFYSIIKNLPLDKLNEIRIRKGRKIVVIISNRSYFLSNNGLTGNEEKAISCYEGLIEETIKKACENSVYAYNDQIKRGFITFEGGIRIGLGGEGVYDKDNLSTIKNINSLAIRIPHQVNGCSRPLFPYLIREGFLNTLIVSPPGAGKTTYLRDIICELSKQNYCYNILLADERGEIANCFDGKSNFDIGNFCDVLTNTNKSYAFECGIRALRPDIVVTDELSCSSDYNAVEYAKNCGVKVLASIHAKSVEELRSKPNFENVLKNKVFDRFVLLSFGSGPGTIEAVYDENLRYIGQVWSMFYYRYWFFCAT